MPYEKKSLSTLLGSDSTSQTEQKAEASGSRSQLEQDIEDARKAQGMERRNAPEKVSIGVVFEDPRVRQCMRLVPEAFGKSTKEQVRHPILNGVGATMDVFYGDKNDHRLNVALGWEPVGDKGEHAQNGGQLLYKRPKDIGEIQRSAEDKMAKERLRALEDQADQSNPLMKAYADDPRMGGSTTQVADAAASKE